MRLLATAMSGEKRGGEGGVLVQRKMAAGVCGCYTSELECTSSVRLARRVGEQTPPMGCFCNTLFNCPSGLCSIDCNIRGGRPLLPTLKRIVTSPWGSIDPVPKGQEVWKKEG
jgi:hypothetical protein